MRYIDIIRTLIRNASEKDIPALDWDEQQKHLSMIKARIDDVELVVRCMDCKHRDPEDKKCDCGHDILWQLPRADEWFCADGERGDAE